jgi:hypothetical protein
MLNTFTMTKWAPLNSYPGRVPVAVTLTLPELDEINREGALFFESPARLTGTCV